MQVEGLQRGRAACAPVHLQFNTSLSNRTNLCIRLYPWWVKDAADMLPGFLPFFPDPSVIEEGHTQSITALVTVKSLYQVYDILGNLLSASGQAAAVKSKLATGDTRDY